MSLGVHFCDSLLIDYFVYSQMAKNAMSMLQKFEVADHPLFYLNYYGMLAWRFEPLLVCAEELRRAFEAALSLGQVDTAFFCSIHSIKSLIFSGARLKSILKEVDYYLHLLKTYKSEVSKKFLLIYRETVSLLIDNGKTTSIDSEPWVGDLGNKLAESSLFNKVIQCLWSGAFSLSSLYNCAHEYVISTPHPCSHLSPVLFRPRAAMPILQRKMCSHAGPIGTAHDIHV